MFNNKIKLFVCLLIPVNYLTPVIALSSPDNNAQKKQAVSDSQKPVQPLAQANTTHSQTKGIILRFHQWPTQEEEKTITNQAQQSGLKANPKKFKRFEMWAFEWTGENKSTADAIAVCKKLSDLSFVKFCEPDHKAILNKVDNKKK